MKDRIRYSKRAHQYSGWLYPSEILTLSKKESIYIFSPENAIEEAVKDNKDRARKKKKYWIYFTADKEEIDTL